MPEIADLFGSWDWTEPELSQSQAPLSVQWIEEPVPLDVFVGDQRYLKNPPLSEEQFSAVQHAERIFFPSTYAELAGSSDSLISEYWSQPVRMVNFLTLEWGKGGGKDHTCRIMSARVAYLLLCLPSPQEYYGFAPQDEIHLLNVASSAPQANRAFFGPLRKAVTRKGCWLDSYADPLVGSIRYANGVEAISGHSDAETQEGLNLILAVADEIDAFKREEELEVHRSSAARESTKSAEAILKMMRSSMITRFPLVGKNVRISYPRYKGSMIQQLVANGRKEQQRLGDGSRHYVSGPKATWEVNPLRSRSDFDAEYEDDPVLARARYECAPAAAINPYFSNEVAVESCVLDVEQEPLAVKYEPERHRILHPDGDASIVHSWTTIYDFAARLLPKRGAVYSMHADLAVKKDRAGICMSHVRSWDEQEVIGKDSVGGDVRMHERRPFVVIDFVFGYTADLSADPPREIQIRWARELCLEMRRRGFNVRWFSYDQFNSVDSMQILESNGIETKRVSTDLSIDPYRGLRDLFNEGRIELPLKYEPDREPLILRELYGLNKLASGKLDHPVGGCFAGETRVPLLDGREVQISELADGEPVWVYSSDENGYVVPALAMGRRTKQVRQLCDVVIDTGATVRCTPEHLWRLRDGTYKEAQYLTRDDRLLPLSRRWDFNSGYEMAWSWGSREQQGRWTHVLVREYMDGDRSLLDTEVSHHDNENKRDNRPENLIRMDSTEHRAHHSRKRHAEDPEYHETVLRAQRKYWASDEARERQRAVMQQGAAWESQRLRAADRHQVRVEMLRQVRDAKSVGAAARRIGVARNSAIAALKGCGFTDWADFLARDGENHRVRFVELVELEEPVWVYDLEVDLHHNFALTAGVFVHNSKDLADSLACSVQGAIQMGGQEDGGIAQLGGQNFYSGEPGESIELPVGFVPPMAASSSGFSPHEVMENRVDLSYWEDQVFGGGTDNESEGAEFWGPGSTG
jgi:intein-like protein with splicing domain